jgi:hypothetical protein
VEGLLVEKVEKVEKLVKGWIVEHAFYPRFFFWAYSLLHCCTAVVDLACFHLLVVSLGIPFVFGGDLSLLTISATCWTFHCSHRYSHVHQCTSCPFPAHRAGTIPRPSCTSKVCHCVPFCCHLVAILLPSCCHLVAILLPSCCHLVAILCCHLVTDCTFFFFVRSQCRHRRGLEPIGRGRPHCPRRSGGTPRHRSALVVGRGIELRHRERHHSGQ